MLGGAGSKPSPPSISPSPFWHNWIFLNFVKTPCPISVILTNQQVGFITDQLLPPNKMASFLFIYSSSNPSQNIHIKFKKVSFGRPSVKLDIGFSQILVAFSLQATVGI